MANNVKVSDFVRDVRVAMDRNAQSDTLEGLADDDTLRLDELIASKLDDAVRDVYLRAPVSMFAAPYSFSDKPLTINADKSGHIELPDDFLRFVSFQMESWPIPVYELTPLGSKTLSVQGNQWTGLRGTPEHPVVTVTPADGGRVLRFWSAGSDGEGVTEALYMPKPDTGTGLAAEMEVDTGCYRAAVYMAGALTASALGQTAQANAMTVAAGELLGLSVGGSS